MEDQKINVTMTVSSSGVVDVTGYVSPWTYNDIMANHDRKRFRDHRSYNEFGGGTDIGVMRATFRDALASAQHLPSHIRASALWTLIDAEVWKEVYMESGINPVMAAALAYAIRSELLAVTQDLVVIDHDELSIARPTDFDQGIIDRIRLS